MVVYLYSFQKDVIKIIADELESLGHTCVTFTDQSALFCAFSNREKAPDLLAADYTVWNHDLFPFMEYLEEQNFFQPFIYYNEPCLIVPKRSLHWEQILKLLITRFPMENSKVEQKFIHSYRPLFEQIEAIVESKALSKYIPLMKAPDPIPDHIPLKNSYNYMNQNIIIRESIYDFQERVNLPKNLFFLLNMFTSNLNEILTPTQIINYYKDHSKKMTLESLKVLISNLRKYIKNDRFCRYVLLSKGPNYQFMILE